MNILFLEFRQESGDAVFIVGYGDMGKYGAIPNK